MIYFRNVWIKKKRGLVKIRDKKSPKLNEGTNEEIEYIGFMDGVLLYEKIPIWTKKQMKKLKNKVSWLWEKLTKEKGMNLGRGERKEKV